MKRSLTLGVAVLVTLAALPGVAHAVAPTTYYASPAGAGSTCTATQPCSLDGARARVRTDPAATDIVVSLAAGTYRRATPLVLDARDSGRDGHTVTWSGAGAVFSGGRPVTGWQLSDPAREIWRAPLPAGPTPRQLYVNGGRRPRAAGPGCAAAACTVTTTGLTGPGVTALTGFAHPEDLEASIRIRWRNYRCGVASVAGTTLVMEQPCWRNSLSGTDRTGPAWDSTTVDSARYQGVAFFDNAYELLDTPGEWYANAHDGYVYYRPLYAGSDPNTGAFEVSGAETLLQVSGAHDLVVDGLTFSHTGWSQPSTGDGYAGTQAGLTLTGATGPAEHAGRYFTKPAAAVQIAAGRNVTVTRSTFSHLGGAGLRLDTGTQHTTVTRDTFTDISSGGIYVGDTDPHPTAELLSLANTVSYNTISATGTEFTDSVGVWAGYDAELTIDHNTITHLPYSGISVGWGWNQPEAQNSALRDNRITNNTVSDVLLAAVGQHDGGAIYTQGVQPRSVISGNYLNRSEYGGPERDGNGIYLDEQSSNLTVEGNVVTRVGYKWVSNWASYGRSNTVRGNWSDTVAPALSGAGSTMTGNLVGLPALPPEAVAVAGAAGAGSGAVEQLAPDLARGGRPACHRRRPRPVRRWTGTPRTRRRASPRPSRTGRSTSARRSPCARWNCGTGPPRAGSPTSGSWCPTHRSRPRTSRRPAPRPGCRPTRSRAPPCGRASSRLAGPVATSGSSWPAPAPSAWRR
ncbi:right-handed parallel beta-helix repeat-containing protein [Longispora sp. K20-0274]